MSPSARVLYIALKARYGIKYRNNGRIFLSVREAAEVTGLNKDTMARAFRELEHYGFVVQTKGGCLGVDGKGKAPHWRLTELGYMTDLPTRDFLRWNGTKFRKPKNKTPSENLGRTVRRLRTPLSENLGQSGHEVPENFGHTADPACPEISDISRLTTSPHKKGQSLLKFAANPDSIDRAAPFRTACRLATGCSMQWRCVLVSRLLRILASLTWIMATPRQQEAKLGLLPPSFPSRIAARRSACFCGVFFWRKNLPNGRTDLAAHGQCSNPPERKTRSLCALVISVWHKFTSMEDDMKHALKNSIRENMHGLLESIFVDYANRLRANYPGRIIRNAAVFVSGVPEFARLGFIELVDARSGIPKGIPDFLVRTIKRAKHQPIWIPGENFPDEPFDIFDQMRPAMRNNEIVWRHIPAKRSSTWRLRALMPAPLNRLLH